MKLLRTRLLWIGIFASFLLPRLAGAELAIPPIPDHYVNDEAGLLSAATRDSLEAKLSQFERDTSNQILVVTFPNLQGEEIQAFSIRLAEKWKPGQSGRDNGAILVVSKGDHRARIEVGYGLEAAIPDATAKSILSYEILPLFKQGDYDGGIKAGVDAILKASAGQYQAVQENSGWQAWFAILILALFVLIFLFNVYNNLRNFGLYRRGGYTTGGWGGGGWSSGGGGWGGSSGGGFSSGGGSFGGGGASGSW